MNVRNYVVIFAAVGFALTGCQSKEGTEDVPEGQPSSITITLKGNQSGLKSTGSPTQAQENTITDFTVYVYNAGSGLLEASQSFTVAAAPAGLTKEVTGLTTGAKKIAVVANPPAGFTVAAGSSYTDLATNMIDLDTQSVFDDLTMSGETTATLLPLNDPNPVTISLSRVVAKVRLGTVTVTPDPGHDPLLFTLSDVHIMKAVSTASIGIPTPSSIGTAFYGGTLGTVSLTTKTYLTDTRALGAADDNNRYYYVFPNDNTTGNATLITLEGDYDGTPYYYPFRISSGTLERNKFYTVNVTIKRPGSGSTDPEAVLDPAMLTVTVEAVDWALVTESVEW